MKEGCSYIVAGSRPWNRRVFDEELSGLPGRWHFIGRPEELTEALLEELRPRYLFFLHWSHRVPDRVVQRYDCVCFHMTDVPYGRGGSPLQNLIVRGHRTTRLTALRMVAEMDAGPVYLKRDLVLEGTAEEIYLRAAATSAEMAREIAEREPEAVAQEGEPTVFSRRRPAESRIPPLESLASLKDFIRMLDAEGYPFAFLEHAGFRFEFRRAALYDGELKADVRITMIPPGTDEYPDTGRSSR